jgi:hypothetical protein
VGSVVGVSSVAGWQAESTMDATISKPRMDINNFFDISFLLFQIFGYEWDQAENRSDRSTTSFLYWFANGKNIHRFQ